MGHQGPLLQHGKDYNGSRFNVLVKWENGEIMTEPLSVIAANNPMTCAVYPREHDLLMSKDGNISGTLLSAKNISYISLNRPR
jgi:hypothetical protein